MKNEDFEALMEIGKDFEHPDLVMKDKYNCIGCEDQCSLLKEVGTKEPFTCVKGRRHPTWGKVS